MPVRGSFWVHWGRAGLSFCFVLTQHPPNTAGLRHWQPSLNSIRPWDKDDGTRMMVRFPLSPPPFNTHHWASPNSGVPEDTMMFLPCVRVMALWSSSTETPGPRWNWQTPGNLFLGDSGHLATLLFVGTGENSEIGYAQFQSPWYDLNCLPPKSTC